MNLNEIKIRDTIKEYQTASEEKQNRLLNEFRKEIELYVYAFPKLSYRRSADECADFYLYVLERIHSIIKNFPPDSPVKFKTWFNYVLKNQFVNFYRRRLKQTNPQTLDLDPMESEIAFEQEFQDEEKPEQLQNALQLLPEQETALLKLYYMPERISAQEIRWLSNQYQLKIRELLALRNNLIRIHQEDSKRIRESRDQLAELNYSLVELKYQLKNTKELKDQNKLLLQIARKENSKFKLIRKLLPSEKKLFAEFAILFKNTRRAREHINFAKRQLKKLLLAQTTKKNEPFF